MASARVKDLPAKKAEFIGLWTNKGGVGKTTLTFHLSTTYAHLNPSKRVVVFDVCPQANLSSTLLTSINNSECARSLMLGSARQSDRVCAAASRKECLATSVHELAALPVPTAAQGAAVVAQLKQTQQDLQGPRTVAGYLHRVLSPPVGAAAIPLVCSREWCDGRTGADWCRRVVTIWLRASDPLPSLLSAPLYPQST